MISLQTWNHIDCWYQITVVGLFVDININVWIKAEDGPKYGWAKVIAIILLTLCLYTCTKSVAEKAGANSQNACEQ